MLCHSPLTQTEEFTLHECKLSASGLKKENKPCEFRQPVFIHVSPEKNNNQSLVSDTELKTQFVSTLLEGASTAANIQHSVIINFILNLVCKRKVDGTL